MHGQKRTKARIKTVLLVTVLIEILKVTAKILSMIATLRCLPLVNSSEGDYHQGHQAHTTASDASCDCRHLALRTRHAYSEEKCLRMVPGLKLSGEKQDERGG